MPPGVQNCGIDSGVRSAENGHPLLDQTSSASHKRMGVLGLGLMLWSSLMISGCHPNTGAARPIASTYSLPTTRPSGPWRPPPSQAERRRLETVLKGREGQFQDCMWRHAGGALVGTDSVTLSPLVATFGVEESGKVSWLQLENANFSSYSLRECLSRELMKLEFSPAPQHPTILALTLLPVRMPSLR